MEIGAAAIKAVRLQRDGDEVSVTDFAVVPHKKVLATPDVDQDDLTRLSLGQFISQKSLDGEMLVISVPGHAAFARFAKLPPVDPKKVPDIVKFEAVQQIPFPIDQVEWDYQTFASEDSPDVEVGIFAITRDRVQQRLGLYAELGIAPEALTLSPVAVYNAMAYDHGLTDRKGTIVYLDIGTYATDVIVAEGGRCWIRTFPLGGTHFTEAIANTFKLSYSKAEKLKHEAAASKYAKQIMQAMRPVFSDLLQDLQRSIGYYQTLHRDAELTTMVGIGSTFKIPGLRKFLGQQLQMQVVRLDEYKKISVTGREAATFAQNAVGLATAYGLALQGVGLGRITANLVPVETVRAQLWRTKTKWFAAAAAVIVVGSMMMLYRPMSDRGAMSPVAESPEVAEVMALGQQLKRDYEKISSESNVGYATENFRRLVDYRSVWPNMIYDSAQAIASTDPQPGLLSGDLKKIKAIPPKQRRLVRLVDLAGVYSYEASNKSRRIAVRMEVELSHDRPIEFLNNTIAAWLRDNAERPGVPYRIIDASISCNPAEKQTIRVTATGEQMIGRSGGGQAPPRRSGFGGSGSKRPPLPPPPGGGASGGPGGFESGGGGGLGRRDKRGKRSAPGKGGSGGFGAPGGGSSTPGGGQQRAPTGGYGTPGRTRSTGGRAPTGGTSHASLDSMGPVPDEPSVYPAGSEYYLVPITFEVELLDRAAQRKVDATAAGQASAKGNPS
jgi:type IV pilus assembly protein PilM